MMQAGKLDRRITMQRSTFVVDDYGEQIATWQTLDTVWGQKVEMRGSERYTSAQTLAQYDTKFRIRYRRNLRAADRIICDGVTYDIGPVIEIGRGEGLEFHGKAVGV